MVRINFKLFRFALLLLIFGGVVQNNAYAKRRKSVKPGRNYKISDPWPTKSKIKKKKGMIYFDDLVIPVVDPKTFQPLVCDYSRDADHLYFQHHRVYKATPDDFKPALNALTSKGERYGWYGTVKGGIVFQNNFFPVEDETKVVWGSLVNDGKKGFRYSSEYGLEEVKGVDLGSFRSIELSKFHRDNERVYFHGQALPNCNPENFEDIGGVLSRCGDRFYYYEREIKGTVPKAWLDTGYPDNDHRVLFPNKGEAIFVKPSEIKEVQLGYDQYKDDVYSMEYRVIGLENKSSEVLNGYHIKDRKNVFYRHKPIKGADPDTFRIVDGGEVSQDKNHVYYMGRRVINIKSQDFSKDPRLQEYIYMYLINDNEAVYMGLLKD